MTSCPDFQSVLVSKFWKNSTVLLLRFSYDATWGTNDAALAAWWLSTECYYPILIRFPGLQTLKHRKISVAPLYQII